MNDKNNRGKPIIEVKNLSVHFQVRGAFTKKRLQAVSDVSLEIYPGETYGIVGESGCGKSTLGNAMIGMVRPTFGQVIFKGKSLFPLSPAELPKARENIMRTYGILSTAQLSEARENIMRTYNITDVQYKAMAKEAAEFKKSSPEKLQPLHNDILKLQGAVSYKTLEKEAVALKKHSPEKLQPVHSEILALQGLGMREFKDTRRDMQMIFQDPFSSLNPRFDVYKIISEPMLIRGNATEDEMKARVIELLNLVGLSEKDLYRHPYDFSGGQRQRIGIARAIILSPDFLICDEPVSALDVSVHAQILNLLMELQNKLKMTYIFISHNLAVVKNLCDRMAVMYLGNIMESGITEKIYQNPLHPYTKALLSAVLDTDFNNKTERTILRGDIPSPIDPPDGCRFYQRCPEAMRGCKLKRAPLTESEQGHFVSCHKISGFTEEEKANGFALPLKK